MSDYRAIEITVVVVGLDNIMTDEQSMLVAQRINIAVSELLTVKEVMEEIKKRMLSIEDVL